MKKEIRINTRRMVRRIVKKWIFLLPAMILLTVFIAYSLCAQEVKEYEKNIETLYTEDELREILNDEDYEYVQRVIATDELLDVRNVLLEELRKEEATDENLLKQAELLQEIDEIIQLRNDFLEGFDAYQSRYYWLLTGTRVTMREDIQKPTGLSGHIIAYSAVGAVGISIAAALLIYLLAGFLHTKDELEINFGYDVYETASNDEELLEKVRFLATAEGLSGRSDLVVSGSLKWSKKENQGVKETLIDATNAAFVDDITETVACLEALCGKKVLLVERADDSKLRKISDNDLVIRKAKAEVLGVIFLV